VKRSLPEPVRSLDARVISILRERTETATDALTSYVAEVSRPESVRLIVDAICADDELADHCFHASLTHPLGFDKFLLLTSEAYDLRLHVWWPDGRRGREDIHNHRFSLFSGIITGELRVSAYEICGQGIAMQRFQEVHDESGDKYSYISQRNVCVRQTSTLTLTRGSAYYLSSSVLHQVTAMRGAVVATLFIRVIEPHRTSLILRPAAEPAPTPGTRATLGDGETEKRMRSFLEILGRPAGLQVPQETGWRLETRQTRGPLRSP
jgi:hypothetical protein